MSKPGSIEDWGDIIGRTVAHVHQPGDDKDVMTFEFSDGSWLTMYHDQDCCESVQIEDICGDLADLIGVPMLRSEERSEHSTTEWGTETWTFYEFATIKGSVTIRWLGASNGYYSESVDTLCSWREGFGSYGVPEYPAPFGGAKLNEFNPSR